MKKALKIISISTIFCTILAAGCSKNNSTKSSNVTLKKATISNISKLDTNKFYKYFALPEKIIIYNYGKEKVITKDNALYRKILDLTDRRFNNKFDFQSLYIKMDELNQMKKNELVIEFAYNDLQKTDYFRPFAGIIKNYNGLILPLTGKYTNCMFFDSRETESVGPIDSLTSPDDLIKILRKDKVINSNEKSFRELLGTNAENITKIFVRNGMDGNSIVITDKSKINEFINSFCTFNYSKSLNQEITSGYSYFADFYAGENKLISLVYGGKSTIEVDTVRYDTNKEVNIDKLKVFFNSFPIKKWPNEAK